MEKNFTADIIYKIINTQISDFKTKNETCLVNSSTDLLYDLDLSYGDIIRLCLKLEKEIGTEIVALPIQYLPSFKIGYLVNIYKYAMTFDREKYESELLKYACDNVLIYKGQDNKGYTFHDIGSEFDSIANNYHPKYQYGKMIFNKVVELSGKFVFSISTPEEKILRELPLWRKRNKWYGISTSDKMVQFEAENILGNRIAPPRTTPYLIEKGLGMVVPEHIVTRNDDSNWLNMLNGFSPKWLKGTSCVIYSMCIRMHQLNISFPDIKYIELTAENPISTEIIAYIKDTFENASIAVVITNNHLGPVFISCPEGHYHYISSKPSISLIADYQNDFPYIDLRLTSYFCISAPVIDIDLHLRVKTLDISCAYQNNEAIVEILPACGFDGFAGEDGAYVSVATIKMCIGLVNSEYNNPIAAMQITQIKQGTVRLYLLLRKAFIKWEKRIAESVSKELANWGIPTIEWELVFQDELFPFEYTGAKIYYQNKFE